VHFSSIGAPDSSSHPQGPDVQQQLDLLFQGSNADPAAGGDTPLCFFASELQLRGADVAEQPHHDADNRNILCWNGEVGGRSSSPFARL
jgi:asparagine synthetase B (glutamine-hydrolysing)